MVTPEAPSDDSTCTALAPTVAATACDGSIRPRPSSALALKACRAGARAAHRPSFPASIQTNTPKAKGKGFSWPKAKPTAPATTMPAAKTLLKATASLVALRHPMLQAASALNTLPPSRGNAGNRLKAASAMLTPVKRSPDLPHMSPAAAITRDAIGPAIATAASTSGLSSMPDSICTAAPSAVTRSSSTRKPNPAAAAACASSWPRRHVNTIAHSRTAPNRAMSAASTNSDGSSLIRGIEILNFTSPSLRIRPQRSVFEAR